MKTAGQVVSPNKVGVIHIIGIGGIGMSGIAEILHAYGYQVQGSDLQDSYVTERLRSIGINVLIGHVAVNVDDATIVVKSTAVKDSNPEIVEALRRKLPVIKRSEMLAELLRFKHPIAVSGTHGKTTTTSMIGTLLMEAQLHPTIINGGIINAVGSNVHIGKGDLMVVEADESDGTFIRVPAYIAVITNIDPEHLDYYGDFENAKAAYLQFIENIPFYGFAVVCFDHPEVRKLAAQVKDRRIVSYGLDHQADVMATNLKVTADGCRFDVDLSDDVVKHSKLSFNKITDVFLPIHGKHNVQNCLAGIAVALDLEVSPDVIKNALHNFAGVRRRFTKTGEVDGIMIVDDYAHHPVEIKATLAAATQVAKMRGGSLIAVLQPHRYSRLASLMDDFSTSMQVADHVLVSDVYSAGEQELEGVNALSLIEKIKNNTNQDAIYLPGHENVASMINNIAKPKDLVVFLGAGNITKWAYDLPAQLTELKK